jgi:lysozyme
MKAGIEAIKLLKKFEQGPNGGFASRVYQCSGGKNTIGYGHVILPHETFDVITEKEAEELLKKDIKIAEEAINKYVVVPLTQNRFDALISFVFNIGVKAFKKSTLLKKLNQSLYDEIDEELAKWIYIS